MKKSAWSLLTIDATGAALTLMMLGFGAWSAFSGDAGGLDSSPELLTNLANAKEDLEDLQSALTSQREHAARYRDELAAAGAMPSQTPQETHLRSLSGLAAANHLTVVRQSPLAARQYPGIMEQRFAYEVTWTMADIARFFKAVESSPDWADISYLKVERGNVMETPAHRIAILTFSVFSMSKEQLPPAGQG